MNSHLYLCFLVLVPVLGFWLWKRLTSVFEVREEKSQPLSKIELLARLEVLHGAPLHEEKDRPFENVGTLSDVNVDDISLFRTLCGKSVEEILFQAPMRALSDDLIIKKLVRSMPSLDREKLLVMGAGNAQQVFYNISNGNVLVVHLLADAVFRYESARAFLSEMV